jgi:hypothetical protein
VTYDGIIMTTSGTSKTYTDCSFGRQKKRKLPVWKTVSGIVDKFMDGLHKILAVAYPLLMHSGTTCNIALLYDVVSPLEEI